MSLERLVPPAGEPVTLAALKTRLRLSGDTYDDRLAQVITAAREAVEAETGLTLMEQGFVERLDDWAEGGRLLAFGTQFRLASTPVLGVDSITVFDAESGSEVWSPSRYWLDDHNRPARLVLRPGARFPTPGRSANGIEIRYRAGFGGDVGAVPAALVEACALWAEALFEDDAALPPSRALALLLPWREVRL